MVDDDDPGIAAERAGIGDSPMCRRHHLRPARSGEGQSLCADARLGDFAHAGHELAEHRQAVWRDPETGYVRKQVFCRPDHPLELTRVELPAGKQVAMPASSYAHIRQAVWVLAGQLVIVEGGDRHLLKAGDCLGFGPPSEVTFANETAKPCTYLVVLARG